MQPPKRSISLQEWHSRLETASINTNQLNSLVLNYLQHEGFQQAAVEFARECPTSMDGSNANSANGNNANCNGSSHSNNANIASSHSITAHCCEIPKATLELMHKRQQIKNAICSGNIDTAIALVNEVNPRILNEDGALFFRLLQQKLLELIRQSKVDEALEFAQQEIAPQTEANPQFLPVLEQTMALLAFDLQKANEQVLQALHPSHRANVAAAVNEAVLEACGEERESKLGTMLKQLSWAQERLAEKFSFPRIVDFSDPEANLGEARTEETTIAE